MFEGPIGKKMMIEQGYVPATCVMDDQVAGPLIYVEVSAGKDPCAGCRLDRTKCSGRANTEASDRTRKIWAMWDASDPVEAGRRRDEQWQKDLEEQRRRDSESEEISGPLFGLDEPITKG